MPPAKPQGSVGPIKRFIEAYGLPPGRQNLSKKSLLKDYKIIKQLNNNGAMNDGIALVEKIADKRQGKRYILKRILFGGKGVSSRYNLREIEILHVLDHPNIIKFIDGCIPRVPRGLAELYVEYCDRGSLQDLLYRYVEYNEDYDYPNQPWENIPEAFVWHVFRSLASALAYLHFGVRHNDPNNPPRIRENWPYILHRDIKPDNILLKTSDSGSHRQKGYPTVVIADFVHLPCFIIGMIVETNV